MAVRRSFLKSIAERDFLYQLDWKINNFTKNSPPAFSIPSASG
jgi:hypothetical protein